MLTLSAAEGWVWLDGVEVISKGLDPIEFIAAYQLRAVGQLKCDPCAIPCS